jgi:hypothetical protein
VSLQISRIRLLRLYQLFCHLSHHL